MGTLISTAATAQEQRFIEVVTEEKMEVNPDEFIVEFRLSEKTRYEDDPHEVIEQEEYAVAEEVTDAVEEDVEMPSQKRKRTRTKPRKRITVTIAEQEKDIKAFLKKNGIDENNLALATNYERYSDNRKYYTLKINNIDAFSTIMNGLNTMGASRVKLQSFNYSKAEEQKNEMAVKALKKAQKQAEKLVRVYGEKLGRVISISEDFGGHDETSTKFYELIMVELMRKNKNKGLNMTINYKVRVKFAIK